MKRREFVEKVGMGSAALLTGSVLTNSDKGPVKPKARPQEGHEHQQLNGNRASTTISFGQWKTPLDRTAAAARPTDNQHLLLPFVAKVKSGGAIMFVVSGFHNIVIYGPGKEVGDVDITRTRPVANPPAPNFPPLIDDPVGRVFRGNDPSTVLQDRTETVTLHDPGRYLIICGFFPHFVNDNMHGFVDVVAQDEDDDDDKKGKGKGK
jgi:plastocyanin